MAFYVDEGDVWKCSKHPSKRRKTGVCPICLHDRLVALCPHCGNVRPCSCCSIAVDTTTLSSSFSFSSRGVVSGSVSNLIDSEPALVRSRSLSIPFLRSKSRFSAEDSVSDRPKSPPRERKSKASFLLSVFKVKKCKKVDGERVKEESNLGQGVIEDDRAKLMTRSRSVCAPVSSHSRAEGITYSSSGKGKSWYFPSPVKVLRQLKSSSRVVHERSLSYRG